MKTTQYGCRSVRWLLASTFAVGLQLLASGALVAEEDHLEGYKITDLNQVPAPATVTIDNQFGSETCELKKAQFFLAQSEKNDGDDARGGAPGDFVCYKAKCTGAVPPLTQRESQFGVHALESKKAKLICLPVDQPCDGELVGGSCWFLGAANDSCDAVCAGEGLTCAPATVTYAGSGGTSANCGAVMAAFAASYIGDVPIPCSAGVGCGVSTGLGARCTNPPTTCSASLAGKARACACQ